MMELVDMRDLGSRAVMRWGSSPHARTKAKRRKQFAAFFYAILCSVWGIKKRDTPVIHEDVPCLFAPSDIHRRRLIVVE